MHRSVASAFAFLAVPTLMIAADGIAPTAFSVGSPAPAIKASRWVKGSPVPTFEKGKVYVVEFWATWCGPCRQTIPHLSEMAKKYEGKATFIGMSVWERRDDPKKAEALVEASVDAFVKNMGDKMNYNVGRDTADGYMADAWMKAASQDGIPTAFVVDGRGEIAWIGHPMNGLEKVLANVVDGKHDIAAAKAEAAKEVAKGIARSAAIKEFMPALDTAKKANDYGKILELVEKAAAKYPDLIEMFERPRFQALLHSDPAKAALELEAEKSKPEPDFETPALVIVGEAGLAKVWYERAAGYLETELKNPEANPALWSYYAKALHLSGRSKEAVSVQEKMLGFARGKAPQNRVKQYEADLKTYQDAAKAVASKG